MSLVGTDKSATSLGAAMAAAQQQSNQQQAQQAPLQSGRGQPTAGFSWRNMAGMVTSPMGRTPQSEILTRLSKAVDAVFKNNANAIYELSAIPVDYNQDLKLYMSVLIVTARALQNRDAGVAYHVLMLEGSVEPFQPKFENIGGENVEILKLASDANDDRTMSVVVEHLRRAYPGVRLHSADACVVPRDFNLDDEQAIYQLAANASFAVTHELEVQRPDFQDINLANASKDDSLVVRVAFPKTQQQNQVGLPVRNDISIDLTAVPSNQAQGSLERQAVVARAGGFIDLVWDPVPQPQGFYFNPQQPQATQHYAARLVLTSMESIFASTLPAQLIALVNAMALRENNTWTQTFRPAPFSNDQFDLHDIGAVNLECGVVPGAEGVNQRIDTKADSFKADSLAKLLALTIKPGLIISMDVEDTGPSSWYNGVFSVASGVGNPSSVANANEAIINAAIYLTNGHFSKYFGANGAVCYNEGNLVHLGYYINSQGQKCDLRDYDYLAVLNRTAQTDPGVIRLWSDSFNRTDVPLARRLSDRKKILNGLTGNSAVFTGFARRITFDVKFLEALVKGCLDCGMDVRTVTPYVDQGSYERAGAGFVQNSLLSPASSGLFNRNLGGSYGGNQGYQYARQGGMSSRW